jgi:hypothetical protein
MVKLLTWLFKRKAKCSAQPKYIRPALRVKKIKRPVKVGVKDTDDFPPRCTGDFPVEIER